MSCALLNTISSHAGEMCERNCTEQDEDGESDDNEFDFWTQMPAWTLTSCAGSKELTSAELSLTKVNQQLKVDGGTFDVGREKVVCLRADAHTGVCMLYARASATLHACEQLSVFLVSPENRTEDGYLQIGELVFAGFGNYRQVYVESSEYWSRQQEQFTCMLPKCHLPHALKHLPGMQRLVDEVCERFGVLPSQLQHVHALVQANPYALFSWHDDASDMRLSKRSTTVVVALNHVQSAFQLWGFRHALLWCRGQMAAFPGAALHRSLGSVFAGNMEQNDITTMSDAVLSSAPHKLVMFFD